MPTVGKEPEKAYWVHYKAAPFYIHKPSVIKLQATYLKPLRNFPPHNFPCLSRPLPYLNVSPAGCCENDAGAQTSCIWIDLLHHDDGFINPQLPWRWATLSRS